MSDEIQIDGKAYISSKRASELSGYAQDYIGQLARKSLIEARRVGGLWHVSLPSLEEYKKKAEAFKPEPPVRAEVSEPGTLVFFDGREYLSAGRAAEVTGYAQDYIGQLARSGKVLSRQVGNRWYIDRGSVIAHKKEKDALLAAVQRDAVGLSVSKREVFSGPNYQAKPSHSVSSPLLNYFSEEGDLLPVMEQIPEDEIRPEPVPRSEIFTPDFSTAETSSQVRKVVPIKRLHTVKRGPNYSVRGSDIVLPMPKQDRRSTFPMLFGAAATIIIVLSVGYASILKQNSVYATNITPVTSLRGLPASVDTAFEWIGDLLEPFLTHDLFYERQGD